MRDVVGDTETSAQVQSVTGVSAESGVKSRFGGVEIFKPALPRLTPRQRVVAPAESMDIDNAGDVALAEDDEDADGDALVRVLPKVSCSYLYRWIVDLTPNLATLYPLL